MALDLLGSLFKKDTPKPDNDGVIGVDVGSAAIKIVQLHKKKNVMTLDTYGELQLGPYEGVEIGRQTHLRIDKLTEALVDILREAAASSRVVTVAISYNASFNAIITMPTDDTDKITAMMPIEAKKYVPVPLSDVTLDWFPVSAHSDKKTTKVLLAAIHNDALKRYEAMVQGIELSMGGMEIEIFSTIRSVVEHDDETVAIIDFGAGSTKLYIVHKGVVGKTYSIPMNGTDLTRELSKAAEVDFRQAEEMKRTTGLMGGSEVGIRAMSVILERGLREIHKMIDRYTEEESHTVEKIILSGGGALLKGLIPYTEDMLSCKTVLADPFAKVAYPAFLEDTLKEAGPAFAVALGIALSAQKS